MFRSSPPLDGPPVGKTLDRRAFTSPACVGSGDGHEAAAAPAQRARPTPAIDMDLKERTATRQTEYIIATALIHFSNLREFLFTLPKDIRQEIRVNDFRPAETCAVRSGGLFWSLFRDPVMLSLRQESHLP